jgi:hypothetical protein
MFMYILELIVLLFFGLIQGLLDLLAVFLFKYSWVLTGSFIP